MAGNQFFLGGIDVTGATLARIDEREAIATYSHLIEEVRARCGGDVADLFAEPIIGVNRATGAETVSWYCNIEGTPFALRQLDAAARKPVIDLLKQRLRSFSSLLNDPRSGPVLGSWLYVLSADSLMAVAGQPVIKNWGMVPTEVSGSEEARDTHFRNTIGTYLPSLPTPPFLGIEAPAFVGRMAQLADREAARLARPAAAAPPPAAAAEAPPPPPVVLPAAAAGRPWIAPLVASLLAAAVLAVLLVFHLLRYPDAAAAPDAAAIEAQRATNQALRDRLAQLKSGETAVCEAPPPQGTSEPAQPLLPPSPTQTQVTVPGQATPTVGSLAGLLEKATVVVLAGDSLGSGFFISGNHIVTNHHVVGDTRDVRVGNKTLGTFVPGKVIAVGAGRERGTQDLAVIEIDPKPGTATLQIGIAPERLEPVTAAGYPGAVLETIKEDAASPLPEANFTQGIATSHQDQAPAGIATIIHTAQIGHGNSGGPLVDAGGCAVGVNSWLNFDMQDQTIFSTFFQALDAKELRKFLLANQIDFTGVDAACRPATPAQGTPAPAPPAGTPPAVPPAAPPPAHRP